MVEGGVKSVMKNPWADSPAQLINHRLERFHWGEVKRSVFTHRWTPILIPTRQLSREWALSSVDLPHILSNRIRHVLKLFQCTIHVYLIFYSSVINSIIFIEGVAHSGRGINLRLSFVRYGSYLALT